MRYLTLICCALLLASCMEYTGKPKAPYSPAKQGKYLSHKFGYVEWLNVRRQGFRHYATGFELTLHPDSSYDMLSCSCISNGHWRSDSGKLYLQMEHVTWRIDSLRQYGYKGKWPEVAKEPIVFLVNGNNLYQVDKADKRLTLLDLKTGL